ncbi:transcription initiation factor TFIID subunit 10-like protein [Pavlovales sp. CCMP2436]|nr:transcription initiation factor TFIID subunit 10-like protein [Pavlovales sp. CCMP2436]
MAETPRGAEEAQPPPPVAKVEVEDLLAAMESFVPTIPEEVTHHYLRQSGFQTSDERIVRLVTLAAQKFASDVVQDSLQRCKWRREALRGKDRIDGRLVLATEDLTEALKEHGVTVVKPLYYADRDTELSELPQ